MLSRIRASVAWRGASARPLHDFVNDRQRSARFLLPPLLAALAVAALSGLMLTEQPAYSTGARGHVSVRAAGRGLPDINLRDGYTLNRDFRGDQLTIAALRVGNARALALASADFDRNGTPDIVAGYAVGTAGAIALQRGNPDAFAPSDESVFQRLQRGYDPESLLTAAQVYAVPVAPDFLVAGKFSSDGANDVVLAGRGGGLYLLHGDAKGGFSAPREIPLPGKVTALAAGEFRTADGYSDLAVGVALPDGNATLLMLDDAANDFAAPALQWAMTATVSAIEFGGLDDDAFQDVAVASGSDVLVVHGWDRGQSTELASRVERIALGQTLRGLAVGEFAWDRAGRSEIAALTADGSVHILRGADVDTRPYSDAEAAVRKRGEVASARPVDGAVFATSWQRGAGWVDANQLNAHSFAGVSAIAAKPLLRTNLSYRDADDLLLLGDSQPRLEIVQQPSAMTWRAGDAAASALLARTTLEVESAAAAVLALPRKLNGVRDVVVLDSKGALTMIPQAPNTTITVDRTDDPSGAALTAASACTAAANDCSLRGAFEYANDPLNNNTTINVPANTYLLSINGTLGSGCDGNAQGDLGANQTMTLVGAGAGTTVIAQTGTGAASDGDRVLCLNETFALGLTYNFSAVSFVGGRAGTAAGVGTTLGGAGIIGGEKGNALTLTNVVIANNQVTATAATNLGGGGLLITGGDLTINSSTIGGTSAPGLYTDRTNTTTGNSQAGSGGGFLFTPSARQHTASTGTLTIIGSTISRNTSSGAGGGGADLATIAFALPGGSGTGTASMSQSTFTNNQALGTGNGAGLLVESLPMTVSISNFTNNAASNHGGGIYVSDPGLTLDGTSPSINFSGNTATNGGNGVSTASTVTVAGANTSVSGDIEVLTGGVWTNNTGSTLGATNVVITGGTLTANNSTTNLNGSLSIGPGPAVGGTFNANTGTVNMLGNLLLTAGGTPATSLSGGTSTFNFNGSAAQSITNGVTITFNNLTDANVAQPLTLNNNIAVNGTLNVNGANAILSPVAAAVISGSGTLTGTGTARVSRTTGTSTFLNQYTITNKTLTQLNVDYNGTAAQSISNTPAYSRLTVSGTGIKTLQGNTTISGDLNIAAATMASGNFNFSLGGNWTNAATFTPGTGTVTFAGTTGTQTLTGNTTFYNLTLNNAGATTNFANTTTTIGNDLVVSAGTMDGGTSTIAFTGVTDNAGAISGAGAKNFHTLQINTPAVITNNTGADVTIENNYTNNGTFVQGAALTTTFATDNNADGAHVFAGTGTTTFGNVVINASNTVDAGPHNFNVVGANFNVVGTFTGNTSTATFNGAVAQSINGNGAKNFSGLRSNNASGVQLANGTAVIDASVAGALTLTTDLTVAAGALLQQSGTSAGTGDVIGTVRRTDLGATAKSFGNVNNAVTIDSGTAPTQLDVTLVKAAPTPFPALVKVVARDITMVATGGAGYSATVALRYVDPGELTGPGITETSLMQWRNNAGTWTAQGGSTLDTTNNFVSLSGVTSFGEWAIAEGTDLTLTKTNTLGGTSVVGRPWNWTLAARNSGTPVTFTAGQTILIDNLPNSGLNYGAVSVQNVSNMGGSANISCAIASSNLTCTANGGSVTFNSNLGASGFDVVFQANPQVVGTYANPRSGGVTSIDPGNVITESNEGNNSPSNTVVVNKANTTVAITSANPNPSQIGQAVQVTWNVFVQAPGAMGATLTGTVTVTDGTDSCSAPATTFASQCNVTFNTAGVKNITATYTGDSNYNGSASTPPTSHTVYFAPTIAKAFAPSTILLGASSTVTMTLSNTNAVALNQARFTDTLVNMRAVGGAVGGTCVGTLPVTLVANATALSFTGITIPANGSCTVTFAVTSNTAGVWPNTTSGVATTQTTAAGTPSNTANLIVGDLIFANGFE